jgi:interleukin-1 receptor-associated kinase 4
MIRLLLERGAEPMRRSYDGATCVDKAGNEAVRSLLRFPPATPAARAADEAAERRRAAAAAAAQAQVAAARAAAADAAAAAKRRADADAAAALAATAAATAATAAAATAAAEQRAAAAAAASRGLTAACIAPDGAPVEVSIDYVRAATAQFAAGRRLGGVQPGGFGDVFRGADASLGVRFAVKRLRGDAPWPPERSASREIQILTQFRHPHIIRLWGYTTHADAAAERCLLYELGDGGALSDVLCDDDAGGGAAALSWRARLRVAAGVAAALHYLHTSSATPAWHRDVKAANVVLTASLSPKLIDCGVSKLLTEEEAARGGTVTATTGVPFGTAAYMCPVYLRVPPHRYGEKAECYSFGLLLCELLTGKLQCFSLGADGNALDLAEEAAESGGLAALRDARPPAWQPGVLASLESLAAACVRRKPDARPPFARVREALSELCAAHATPSADEAALAATLETVRAQRDALLAAREAADADAEAAGAGAEHDDASSRRECCVFVACPPRPLTLADGLECAPGGHFVCGGCLSAAVHARGDGAAERLRCLSCGVGPFRDRDLVLRLSEAAGLQYLSQVAAASEAAAARALERSFEARVTLAVSQRLTEDATAALRRAVLDDILTLRCPHAGCRKALPDYVTEKDGSRSLPFDGCFAVECSDERGHGCGGHFCAWCFVPFPAGREGAAACHAHVGACARNAAPGRDVWGGPAAAPLFARALRAWRAQQLHKLLQPLPHQQRDALRRAMQRELADAGLM